MELRHLRYFVAVAEELHFGRAAVRLGMAQPPLSQQIRQLERELGVALFVRASRRVTLTEAGRVLLGEARQIAQRVAAAAVSTRRAARGETGSLAIGIVASATYGPGPRIVRTFRARHPDIALTLSVMSTAAQVVALRAGRIQLGLARPPFGDETLVALPLRDEPVVLALPEGHPLESARPLALRALAEEPFVLFPREGRPGWYDFVEGLCRDAGFRPVVAQEAQDLASAMALVASGVGVTLIPASVQDLRRSSVAYRALAAPAPRTTLLALRRQEDLPVVDRFLAVAREVLAADKKTGRAAPGPAGRRDPGGRP